MKLNHFILAVLSALGLNLHAAVVRIQIDPAMALTPVADDFIGFGYETSAVAREGFFSAKNTHMV